MPLPFLCKAVYFSFLDDKSSIIVDSVKIPRDIINNLLPVQNLSFNTSGAEVSLPVANYTPYMGTENCLLLSKEDSGDLLVFHITEYNFTGNQMYIKAKYTPYSINYSNVEIDSGYYYLQTNTPKDALTTFIEWGYAHDSICKTDGTLNITSDKNSDLYTPCYNGNCEIINKRFKLVVDLCDNKEDSEYIDNAILYWVYAYIEPRNDYVSAQGSSASFSLATYYLGSQLPYVIACYPVLKEGYDSNVTYSGLAEFRNRNNDSSYIYSLKISATPPTQKFYYEIDRTNNYIKFGSSTHVTDRTITDTNIIWWGSTPNNALIEIEELTPTPYNTLPILNSDLQEYGYPVGTRVGQRVSKSIFKSKDNPYIALHTTKLRLTNSIGGVYDYDAIDLGLFYEIGFKIYDPLLIDNTNVFIGVDTSYLTYSRLTKDTIEDYNGLMSVSNTNMIYSNDLLAQYIADNKNAYDTFYMKLNYGVIKNSFSGLSKILRGNYVGGASDVLFNIPNAIIEDSVFKDNMENLASARDNLNYTANNIFMALSVKGIGYYVEIATTTDYIKEILYKTFIDQGINLNKFVDADRTYKYLTITNSSYDKTYYKFVKAKTNLRGDNLYNTKQLLAYQTYLQNGMQLFKTNEPIVGNEASVQDNVLTTINEEEIN